MPRPLLLLRLVWVTGPPSGQSVSQCGSVVYFHVYLRLNTLISSFLAGEVLAFESSWSKVKTVGNGHANERGSVGTVLRRNHSG